MKNYLIETPLLDYQSPIISELIAMRRWDTLPSTSEKISAIYAFVRDEIHYEFPEATNIPASQVLVSQSGSPLTKTTLLMALLRGVRIHCRMEPVLIHRSLYSGIIAKWMMIFVPKHLYHSSISIYNWNEWVRVGGYSIDRSFIEQLQTEYLQYAGSFYRYGLATQHFRNPYMVWNGAETYNCERLRSTTVGTYDDPDSFYAAFPKATTLCSGRQNIIIRNHCNKRIRAIREGTFFK